MNYNVESSVKKHESKDSTYHPNHSMAKYGYGGKLISDLRLKAVRQLVVLKEATVGLNGDPIVLLLVGVVNRSIVNFWRKVRSHADTLG